MTALLPVCADCRGLQTAYAPWFFEVLPVIDFVNYVLMVRREQGKLGLRRFPLFCTAG